MSSGLPAMNKKQQEEAVERIHALMAEGMSSGEAIQRVASEIRAKHSGEMIPARFDEEDE
ncbi:MAG: hypothetical protein XXXJIFNMEKO3_01258 [Candidatus Erwinia impunctatus]|nr:hypothetical protein XXXJIFNMEKO_01258 [Culicoides impunctatus]